MVLVTEMAKRGEEAPTQPTRGLRVFPGHAAGTSMMKWLSALTSGLLTAARAWTPIEPCDGAANLALSNTAAEPSLMWKDRAVASASPLRAWALRLPQLRTAYVKRRR